MIDEILVIIDCWLKKNLDFVESVKYICCLYCGGYKVGVFVYGMMFIDVEFCVVFDVDFCFVFDFLEKMMLYFSDFCVGVV